MEKNTHAYGEVNPSSKTKYLVPVQPEISSQLIGYLQPGRYPEPATGSSEIVRDTNDITKSNHILQAFAYWLVIAHTVCEYSFAARLAKEREKHATMVLQFSSSPMKVEYSDGEIWYYDLTSLIFHGICNFIPIEYDFTVNTEKISVGSNRMRKDEIYTFWVKILFPNENKGYINFDLLNKAGKRCAEGGVILFTLANLFIHAKLVLKYIDSNYQNSGIHFRVPEISLDYDYTEISVRVERDPNFEKSGSSSLPRPDIDQMLADFFNQYLPVKKTLIRRILQNLINQIGPEIMKAKSISQCICILKEALSQRPANFKNCSEIINELSTEVYFLVNDKKSRKFIMNFFKNSISYSNSIFIFNRAFYSNEYATIEMMMMYPSTEKKKSNLRSYLLDERISILKLLDETAD